ncbi:MAG: amino acid--tRNA ligase-related protein, partial [Candidatus Heimdallarchaeaceae archaeon]
IFEVIEITENIIERILDIVTLVCSNTLEECDREFVVPSVPFSKISYSDLHDLASKHDHFFTYGDEVPAYVKEEVSNRLKKPLWVIDYPVGSRKVPYRENPYQPGYLASADLFYPNGKGVAASGGERITDVPTIISYLENSDENIKEYQPYLDMLETDGKRSTGVAIGIEPLLRYILG